MRRASLCLCTLAVAACGAPQHDSPFDPSTPAPLQARARLSGLVTLEAVGGTAPALSGVHVSVPGTSFSADTDLDGRYAITGVPPGTWAVQAVHAGWVDAEVRGIPVTLDDGNKDVPVPPLALVLARGQVAGRMLLDKELTSGGVSVSLEGLPGASLTDAAGDFLLEGVPVGTYTLSASKVGFLDTVVNAVIVDQGQATAVGDVTLPYDPGAFLGSVLVVGASDSGGVLIRASGTTLNGSPYEDTTFGRPDGTYLFSGLPGGTYNVSFELKDYAIVATSAAIAPGRTTALPAVSLVRDTGSVVGTATLQGSGDSSGTQVSLVALPIVVQPPPVVAAAVTDASGNWRLDGLPVGGYQATYQHTGYQQQTGTVTVLSHAQVAAAPVQLPAVPGVLRGTVLLEGAAAGGSANTSVSIAGATGLFTTTQADGSWVLNGIGSGNQTVVLSHAGFDDVRVQVVLAPGGDLTLATLTLAISRGGLSGTFKLAGLASSAGVVVSASGAGSGTAVTDASGAFSLSGLPVGTYAVTASHDPDWKPVTVTGVTIAASSTASLPGSPVQLQPIASASVSGVATLERPSDSSGTSVLLGGVDFLGGAVNSSTTTGPTGAWSFSGLRAGSYQVTYAHARYTPPAATGVALASGQVLALAPVSLAVARGAVSGSVALSAGAVAGFPVGADLSGVVVTVAVPAVVVPAAVTDATGAYRFDQVPVSLDGSAYVFTATRPYYLPGTGSATVAGGATVAGPALTLTLNGGGLSGTVQLWDNVAGAGQNASSAGATVTASGVAFNGAIWTAPATTAADGSFSLPSLPPGSFDLVAASAGRTCTAFARVALPGGGVVPAGTVRCTDALAPGAVTLGAPTPSAGAQAGYTSAPSVVVPVAAQASDPTVPVSNLRGYQLAVGAAPDWSAATLVAGQPATLTFSSLPHNAPSTLWARAVDWVGNAGPAASVAVVQDDLVPLQPSISTPRSVVNATTTSVTLSGSESDATFLGYEACTSTVAVGATCPVSPTCSYASTAASFAVSLTASQQTCLWARAVDRAGNRSSAAQAGFASDLTPPTPPTFLPSYDPYLVAVRAPWVDFFLATPATDAPGPGGPWQGIGWIEVDSGAGYQPLCAQPACSAGGTWNPCSCGCSDARLRCDGTRFVGVRASLTAGTSTTVAFRAVDVAGNIGAGVSQQVLADATADVVAATAAYGYYPSIRGGLVGYEAIVAGGGSSGMLLDLGPNRRADAADPTCSVTSMVATGVGRAVVPISAGLVAWADGYATAKIRRPGADGVWCSADDVTTTVRAAQANIYVDGVVGTGEKVAWVERSSVTGKTTLVAREPGPDGLVGTADDAQGNVDTVYFIERLAMGGGAILVHQANCGAACYTYTWRVYSAGTTGSFLSGVTTFDLTTAVSDVALSPDGKTLAYLEGSPAKLVVRQPGADGVYGTGDDVIAKEPLPWAVQASQLTTDGQHVVVTDGSGPNWLVHWSAGLDGVFGTSDDVLERIHPSGVARSNPVMDAGLVLFQSGNDILDVDLTTLRWEQVPAALSTGSTPLAVTGTGTLVYQPTPAAGGLVARTVAGTETAGPVSSLFAARGAEVVSFDGSSGLWIYGTDASGLFFTATAPGLKLFSTTNWIYGLSMGGGKAIAMESVGGNVHYRIFEPNGGSLKDVPTTGRIVDAYPAGQNLSWTTRPAITAKQAFFVCNGIATNNCVLGAGADGRFGTADDVAITTLKHPANSALAGSLFNEGSLVVDGTRMLISESFPPGLYLVDAGPDGLFNTADDVERKLSGTAHIDGTFSLLGGAAVFLDVGGDGGQQVWQVMGLDGPATLLSTHYSPKRAPVVESQGRAFWVDGVMSPEAIFVHLP